MWIDIYTSSEGGKFQETIVEINVCRDGWKTCVRVQLSTWYCYWDRESTTQ